MAGEESKRHPQKALSAQGVKAVKANGKLQRFADGNGLYLVVAPNGSRSWVLRTVIKGKRCDLGLGSASLVALADAREERRPSCAGWPGRAATQWLNGGHCDERSPLSKMQPRRCTRAGSELPERETREAVAQFTFGRSRRVWRQARGRRHERGLASGAVGRLAHPPRRPHAESSSACRPLWNGRKPGFATGDNPAHGLTKVLPKQRKGQKHHAALPYQDLPAFLTKLRKADAREPVRLAFEFLILTAARTSEVTRATWSEVDLAKAVWTVPGSRMKVGHEHRVPLTTRALEVLRRAKELSNGGDFVFSSGSPKKPLSNMVFLMLLRRMERGDITAHGFRSSFRDWASERTNFPRSVCEAALAHTIKDKAEAAYHRTRTCSSGAASLWTRGPGSRLARWQT